MPQKRDFALTVTAQLPNCPENKKQASFDTRSEANTSHVAFGYA